MLAQNEPAAEARQATGLKFSDVTGTWTLHLHRADTKSYITLKSTASRPIGLLES